MKAARIHAYGDVDQIHIERAEHAAAGLLVITVICMLVARYI